MGYDYIVIQVVCLVELPEQRRLCLIFFEDMDLNKWDTIVWYRVTRNMSITWSSLIQIE